MNYYVTIVNKDSPIVVKNLMKLTPRGEKDPLAAVIYKDALMDAIYEAGIPAAEERDFDFVMMTIEAAAEAA